MAITPEKLTLIRRKYELSQELKDLEHEYREYEDNRTQELSDKMDSVRANLSELANEMKIIFNQNDSHYERRGFIFVDSVVLSDEAEICFVKYPDLSYIFFEIFLPEAEVYISRDFCRIEEIKAEVRQVLEEHDYYYQPDKFDNLVFTFEKIL